ncbi:MAG: hypothetical protein R3B09_06095 [Nannocystaceae bacterium]
MAERERPDVCPRCGGRLVEPHALRVRVPFEAEVEADGESTTRWETLAAPAWRCEGCRRIVWRDVHGAGALKASEAPQEGPVEPTSIPRAPDEGGVAGAIALGIVIFSVGCLLLAMALGSKC